VPTTNIPLPEKLDISAGPKQADLWPKWSKRFQRYRVCSGLALKSEQEQVSALLYAMGECADDIMTALRINETTATYQEVMAALDTYFGARRNTIVERARFNRRIQRPGETIDSFINDLYKIAEDCDYGQLKDELIRDRIVVGVLDDGLSDKLQAKADLSLDLAVQFSRQAEARKENRLVVRGETSDKSKSASIDFLKKNSNPKQKAKDTPKNKSVDKPKGRKCKWCGYEAHKKTECPAKSAKCGSCQKKGHYQSMCRSTNPSDRVNEVDIPFLGEVRDGGEFWKADIVVNGNLTPFKLDTGAAVSVLSDQTPWLRGHLHKLKDTTQVLRGPGGTRLPVLGTFKATLRHRAQETTEPVYVIRNQQSSLLSKNACVNLGLIKRMEVNEIGQKLPNFKEEFPKLFTGLGKLKSSYRIQLKDDAKPLCLYTPRKIPHPLRQKVKTQIESMVKSGVISPVTEPTDWCSGMVAVPKTDESVRICVDLTPLNKEVKREVYPMASVQDSLSKLASGRIYSKLDANSGFWQIPLDEESRLLTCFVTPFGRYCFNRVPFGISSAPEIFQRAMSRILEGLEGVICHMDDILILGKDQAEHDVRVRKVLHRIQEAGLTLNNKCEFSQTSIKFLGHIIDATGIRADPKKTAAIRSFPVPSTVVELQRFNGMVNQLGRFIPKLASINEPLRQLLKKDTEWVWGKAQQQAFKRIKDALIAPETLAHYDPQTTGATVIAADASAYGIGAVLLQDTEQGSRRPICYASRSLSETEQRYAVIEKEALAVTWACEQFSEYILGLKFKVETDHKPLVPLLNSTDLSKMPARILRFRLRLMRFSPEVQYVPGKQQVTADALSRAPVGSPESQDKFLVAEVETFANQAVKIISATDNKLAEIRDHQKQDEVCAQVRKYCEDGWPEYMPHTPLIRPYWEHQSHLSLIDDLLLYDDRIVVPRSLRLELLECVHQGHMGITKCRARARSSIWWPGLSKSVEEMVSSCHTCAKARPEHKEPLMPSSFPSRPWERVAMDLFELKGTMYIIIVDYYSRWAEFRKLDGQTSTQTIEVLKEVYSVHGIPDIVVSDNGPQFASEAFKEFARQYGFVHVTSSPKYPQSNGEAERAVRTMKEILKKNEDPYLALLSYRTTPLANGLSPSQLLMGRRLRTQLPILPGKLGPGVTMEDLRKATEKEGTSRDNQKLSFDKRHRATGLPDLHTGNPVWIRDQGREGTVVQKCKQPRSYLVQTPQGVIKRNRSALVATPQPSAGATPQVVQPAPSRENTAGIAEPTPTVRVTNTPVRNTPAKVALKQNTPAKVALKQPTPTAAPAVTRTRSGRISIPPKRLDM
jgi:transposase InsO family protein